MAETRQYRASYVDGVGNLDILDGSAKSCDLYAEMMAASAKHRAMVAEIERAFCAPMGA